MAVLESLPLPDTLTFEKTKRLGSDAISILLGDRPNSYWGKCQSWACILLENKDIKPPVIFYDQESPKEGGRTRAFRYPRSASSLLRKATDLRPPFCFLQHDPHNGKKDMRNMLCAIILYQAVKMGVDTCALRWTQFEDGLGQALRYIDSYSAYREWRHRQKIALLKPPYVNRTTNQVERKVSEHDEEEEESVADKGQPDVITVEETRTVNRVREDNFTGGMVRSTGSDMIIQPGTGLSRLRKLMGKKFELIDYIPATSIVISRHTFSTALFAFRLQLGTYDRGRNSSLPVYVYPAHDGKNVMKILDGDGRELAKPLTFENLEGVDLLQPFATLWANEVGAKPKARAAKLRYMVSYYLLLAENQSLTGVPPVTISEVFGQKMSAACNELRQAKTRHTGKGKWTEDNDGDGININTIIDASSNSPPEPTGEPDEEPDQLTRSLGDHEEPSHIVVHKLRPIKSMNITGRRTPNHRGELLDGGSELDQIETSYDKSPLEVAPGYDRYAYQFQVLSPSKRSHKSSEPLIASLFNGMGDHGASAKAIEMEAPERGFDNKQIHRLNATMMPLKGRTDYQSGAETAVETMHVAARGNCFSIEGNTFANRRIGDDKEVGRCVTIDKLNQDLHAKAYQDESDQESVPMDISSSSPSASRSRTPAILVNETRASSVSDSSIMSDFNSRTHTAPKSSDRAQQMSTTKSQALNDWQVRGSVASIREQSLKSRNESEQTLRVNVRTCAETNVIQLPSVTRGKKRKSHLEFDINGGVVKGVNDGGMPKAFRNR